MSGAAFPWGGRCGVHLDPICGGPQDSSSSFVSGIWVSPGALRWRLAVGHMLTRPLLSPESGCIKTYESFW